MLLYLFLKTRFAIHTRTRTELKVSAIKRVQSKREKERERERERENTSIAPSTLLFTPTTTFPVRLLPPRKWHVFVFYHVP